VTADLSQVEFWTVFYDVEGLVMKFCVTPEVRIVLKAAYERSRGVTETRDGDTATFIYFSDIAGARCEVPRRGYIASVESTPETREQRAMIESAMRKHKLTVTGFDDDD